MRIILYTFYSLLIWLTIILITSDERLATDGSNIYGFPKAFLELYFDEFEHKYVWKWNYLGVILNMLLLILIYTGLNQLRKYVLARKKAAR